MEWPWGAIFPRRNRRAKTARKGSLLGWASRKGSMARVWQNFVQTLQWPSLAVERLAQTEDLRVSSAVQTSAQNASLVEGEQWSKAVPAGSAIGSRTTIVSRTSARNATNHQPWYYRRQECIQIWTDIGNGADADCGGGGDKRRDRRKWQNLCGSRRQQKYCHQRGKWCDRHNSPFGPVHLDGPVVLPVPAQNY